MKNKGFTLVELLAVIVILAIVSMVTYSVVSGSIENTKKKGFETSAKNALEAAKEYVVANYEESDFPEGGIDITKEDVGIKNNNFISGMIVRNEEGIIEVNNLTDGEYCANGTKNKMEVVRGSCTASDETKPEIGIKVLKTKINNVTIMVKMQDAQSGLKEYTYCYGLKGTEKECKTHSLSNERTLVKELIKLDKLKQEAEYEIEVKVKNNSGEEEIEENAEIITFKTLEIEAPEFSISADTYTSSKVLTITYPEVEGYIYKYNKCVEDVCEEEQIVEGTETKVEITGEAKVKASIYKGEEEIISDTINIVGIDNEPPTTILEIQDEDKWTLSKKIKLTSEDSGTGLALRPYSLDEEINWVKLKNNEFEKEYKANEKLKIRTRDKLGNVQKKFKVCKDGVCTEYEEYPIKRIDNIGPRIDIKVTEGTKQASDNEWYTSNRVGILLTIEDQAREKDENGNEVVNIGGIGINESLLVIKVNNVAYPYTKISNGNYMIYITENGISNLTVSIEDMLKNKTTKEMTIKKDDVVPSITGEGREYTGSINVTNSFVYNAGKSGIKNYGCNPASLSWKSSNVTCTLSTNSGYTVSKTVYFRFYYGATANYQNYSYDCGYPCHDRCEDCHYAYYYWGPVQICQQKDCNFRTCPKTCSGTRFTGYSCPSGGSLSGSKCYY